MTDKATRPEGSDSSDQLGLVPERANLPPQIGRLLKPGMRFGQPVYSAEQMYAYAAQEVAAERERCAKAMQAEWLVKVRRLVQGFEHVSGLARLWEPDHSSGSERALWARATEACADVAKMLDSRA